MMLVYYLYVQEIVIKYLIFLKQSLLNLCLKEKIKIIIFAPPTRALFRKKSLYSPSAYLSRFPCHQS
uniref:Uncharacterized protein n=1 Tax=Rhizophora mucronata TaxID=61149 RepID=A0A2P2J1M2_RHIMU